MARFLPLLFETVRTTSLHDQAQNLVLETFFHRFLQLPVAFLVFNLSFRKQNLTFTHLYLRL